MTNASGAATAARATVTRHLNWTRFIGEMRAAADYCSAWCRLMLRCPWDVRGVHRGPHARENSFRVNLENLHRYSDISACLVTG